MIQRTMGVFALLLWGGIAQAMPIMYTLNTVDDITATTPWGDATLTTGVVQNSGGLWQYNWHWTTGEKDLSHIIFGTSPSFTENNVYTGSTPGWELGLWGDQGNSNPGIPDDLYGLKWGASSTDVEVRLVTNRAPVWGDFYAKDGTYRARFDVYAYTKGTWGIDETSSIYTQLAGKILVPDTSDEPPGRVPEPGTLILMGLGGLGLLGFTSNRKRLSK